MLLLGLEMENWDWWPFERKCCLGLVCLVAVSEVPYHLFHESQSELKLNSPEAYFHFLYLLHFSNCGCCVLQSQWGQDSGCLFYTLYWLVGRLYSSSMLLVLEILLKLLNKSCKNPTWRFSTDLLPWILPLSLYQARWSRLSLHHRRCNSCN